MLQTDAGRLGTLFILLGEGCFKVLNGYFSKNGSLKTLIVYMKLFLLSLILVYTHVQHVQNDPFVLDISQFFEAWK
jgi:hypothetical protein